MKKLEGVVPPMVTPFAPDGSLDEYNLTKLVHFLSEHVHGLFICGSYGNGPLMNVEEKKRVIDVVAKNIAPAIQLVVHVGATNVRDAVDAGSPCRRGRRGQGLLGGPVLLPPYPREHQAVLRATGQGREDPGLRVQQPEIHRRRRSTCPSSRSWRTWAWPAIKDSSFDIMTLANFVQKIRRPDFDVVLGTEAMFLYAATIGVRAFIPGLGQRLPRDLPGPPRGGHDVRDGSRTNAPGAGSTNSGTSCTWPSPRSWRSTPS